ncbi:MAG: hypothetical protein AAGF79_13205 [Pseudomonadota bacterium]
MRRMVLGLLGVCLALLGCALDKEDTLRAELTRWLALEETLEFSSRPSCTAAVFKLKDPVIRGNVAKATTLDMGLRYLQSGHQVAFLLPDTSPNSVSEQVMTADLHHGLAILSNGIGPATRCLSDRGGLAFYAAIMSPEAVLIFDPGGNALTLVHVQGGLPLAIFLRGTV